MTNVNVDNIIFGRAPKNMSSITCFNYNKTGYYIRNYPKPKHDLFKILKN